MAKTAQKKVRAIYPNAAVRAMALYAQGLATPPLPDPTIDDVERMIERVVCVQIDSLHMVRRSHYLLLWSRLGTYDPAHLDQLVFGSSAAEHSPGKKRSKKPNNDRRAFEYWLKEACIIPLKDYRYSLPVKRWRQDENRQWWQEWVANQTNHEVLDHVRARIQQEGGLRTSDFEHEGKRGTWWDWKPAKVALEHLYNTGEFMISGRQNFQRVYDLTARVLPDWVDTTEPTMEERHRYYLERSTRAHGICDPLHASDYTHTRRPLTKDIMPQMIKEGIFLPVEVETANGKTKTMIVHREDRHLLEQAADGALPATHTTFLTPFDSLFWGVRRDMQLFNFMHVMEFYKPEPLRQWGYYSLPILHRDRLVGRFDPKLERTTNTLRIRALHLEPDVTLNDEMIAAIAAALRDFMRFHEATSLVIEKSNPPIFATLLLDQL